MDPRGCVYVTCFGYCFKSLFKKAHISSPCRHCCCCCSCSRDCQLTFTAHMTRADRMLSKNTQHPLLGYFNSGYELPVYLLLLMLSWGGFSQMSMSPAMSRRIRAIINTFNFWTIVLYNLVALNSVDFAKLVAKRLLLKGTTTATVSSFLLRCETQRWRHG